MSQVTAPSGRRAMQAPFSEATATGVEAVDFVGGLGLPLTGLISLDIALAIPPSGEDLLAGLRSRRWGISYLTTTESTSGYQAVSNAEAEAPLAFEPLVLVTRPGELAAPIFVRVEASSSGPVLVDPVTGIWGVGETAEDAVADFVTALQQHASVLEGMGDLSSTPDLEAQLRYLEAHLVRDTGASTPR